MKLDFAAVGEAVKAAGLPILEKDLVLVIDVFLSEVQKQAVAQPGDMVAGFVAMGIPVLKPLVDAELAKLLPDAAKA